MRPSGRPSQPLHPGLGTGCEIPRNSTVDRIDHYFEYARSYGREFMQTLVS